MKAEDEINKLKLANSIINRGTRKLGVRPLNIGEFDNPYSHGRQRKKINHDYMKQKKY